MSSFEYVSSAPRAVSVLPARATRRLTRRDGLLPLVLALELLAGVAFGIAGHAGSTTATSVPARIVLGDAPLVAHIVTAPHVVPSVGPVAPTASLPSGPAVGPLVPGTVRAPLPVPPVQPVAALPAQPVDVPPTPYPTHAPRDPFVTLVKGS